MPVLLSLLSLLSLPSCTADTDGGATGPAGDPDSGGGDGGAEEPVAVPTDHVWIFVMDGVRATESIAGSGDPDAEEAALQRLVDRAVVVPVLENKDATTTEAAHRTMVTGRRQPVSNFPWYEEREWQRALTPTIFEEAVAQIEGAGAIVTGNTVFMDSQGTSLYPDHAGHGVPLETADENMSEGADDFVMNQLVLHIDADTRVGLINLHSADRAGHGHRWEAYTEDIADDLRYIQQFEAEQEGRNTYLVLADHGRHLDPDWSGHGDGCAGCRASWLLAWGHGIDPDLDQVSQVYELADVAPTVAHLLGIELPGGRGRPISEILHFPPDPRSSDFVDPDIAVDGDTIHLVAEHLPGGEGELARGGLVYRRSSDGGATWDEEWFGLSGGGWDTPESPQVVAAGDVVLRAWRAYSRDALNWQILGQASLDGGQTWSSIEVLDSAVHHVATPGFALDPVSGRALALYSDQDDASTDGSSNFVRVDGALDTAPVTWSSDLTTTLILTPSQRVHMPTEIEGHIHNGRFAASFVAVEGDDYELDNENREVFVAVMDSLDGVPAITQVTDDEDVSYWPSLAMDGTGGWLAWSSLPRTEGGRWRVEVATSGNLRDWSEPLVVETDRDAWRPSLVATPDGAVLAWVEVQGTSHSVWAARVEGEADGSVPTLGRPVELGAVDGMIEGLSLATT
ncbi:MAG: hypothetical protein D6798_11185, partial [Deltaproteobacteria bacterium]